MPDENQLSSLSRRRLLGGAATIGGAAALGGTGTMAFFSDEETFANNQLTAGELDLKVDWQEHYSDWLGAETKVSGVHMGSPGSEDEPAHVMNMPGDESGEQDITLWFESQDALGNFMDATSLEAFPDDDSDSLPDISMNDLQGKACDILGDTPAALETYDDPDGMSARTANADTILNWEAYQGGAAPKSAPLVNLHDVKPGDFGEVTFSLHLCNNPGYVWMQGDLVDAKENGYSEPEWKDDNETLDGSDGDEKDDTVELLDEIQTRIWYDEDCDNVYEPGGAGGKVDVMLVLDRSGSMTPPADKFQGAKDGAKLLVDELNDDDQSGLVSFSSDASLDKPLGTMSSSGKSSLKSTIDGLTSGGGTNIGEGIQYAHEELTGTDVTGEITPSGGHRADAEKIIVVLSDGKSNTGPDPVGAAQKAKDDGVRIFSIAYGTGADTSTLKDVATPGDFRNSSDIDDIEKVFAEIAKAVQGEEKIFQGTLREALDALSTPHGGSNVPGIPLDGDRSSAYDELNDPATADARECYVKSTTNCIGFEWWLPVDHGNEVQTDSVAFDLSFYTEQCRHNDGSGQPAES